MNINVVVSSRVANAGERCGKSEKGGKEGSTMIVVRICWAGRSVSYSGAPKINTWLSMG